MPEPASSRQTVEPRLDAEAVLDWYDHYARDLPWRVSPARRRVGERPDPYAVWLSEVMLQQTTIATVRDYHTAFLKRWPTVGDLAAARLDEVMAAWAGLGYYRRARNLHACANRVAGELGGTFPTTYGGLLALPGVGPYTAAAIAAICHDAPVPVVDGNVERVMARFLALDVPVRDAKDRIRAAVGRAVPARSGDFAQALMDLGATICAPRRADCDRCPLEPDCRARGTANPLAYPVPAPKADRPTRFGHAYVLKRADGAVWLEWRPENGMLAGMQGVPTSSWTDEWPDFEPPGAANWQPHGEVRHVFTHFALWLKVWSAATAPGQDRKGAWTAGDALKGAALPTLFRKVLAAARSEKPAKK